MSVRSRQTSPSEQNANAASQRAGSTRSSGLETGTTQMLLGLQRSVGNAGVLKLMARRGSVGSRPASGPRPAGKAQTEPVVQRAGPLVVTAVTAPTELGVGRRATARATVTGTGSAGLKWALSAGAPTGVSIVPRGRQAEIRSAPPVPGAPIGGASFTVSCAVGSGTPILSSPVLLVEVTGAAFTPVPAFGGPFVTAIGTAIAPLNTADPNRNGVSGNSATVVPVTAPAGRAVTVATRGAPGATVSGLSIQPGSGTGRQKVRLTDTPTGTFFDTIMVINSVPTRVSGFGAQTPATAGFYGGWNTVQFGASDPSGASSRPIAEIITVVRDDFGFGAPTGGAGAPSLLFSAPANNWTDQNFTPNTIDVNQFEGPGAIGLPRLILYRQQFFWMSYTGTFATTALATGTHRRTLRRTGTGHGFRTEQIFPGASAPPINDTYAGPLLIRLTGIVAVPAAPGATAIAADGVSTGNLTVTSSVGGRSVNWTVVSGGSSAAITAGAAASAVSTPAVVTATTKPGLVRVRATDTAFANRRGEGTFRVAAVSLGRMTASPSPVPTGVLTATVTVPGRPGGRTVNFAVDSAALGAGVLASAPTVTGIDHSVVLTRPASFIGVVTVTATDSLIPARSAKLKVRFK